MMNSTNLDLSSNLLYLHHSELLHLAVAWVLKTQCLTINLSSSLALFHTIPPFLSSSLCTGQVALQDSSFMWVSYQTPWVRALGFIPASYAHAAVQTKRKFTVVCHKLQKMVSGLTCFPEFLLKFHFWPLQNLLFSYQISNAFKKRFYYFIQLFQFFH